MDKEQARQEIQAAFAGLPIPPARRLIRHKYRRDRAGEERIRQALAGKTWQSLGPDFLRERWASFGYLSPEAYRYYLSALLIGALEEFSDSADLLHATLFSLPPSYWALYYRGKDRDFAAKQSAFTPP